MTEASSSPAVSFFRLTKKFVDSEASVPDDACDVLYYTLAVGHHTGVIDCFEEALTMPLDAYERIAVQIDDVVSRRKLEGIMRFGEIEINKSHVPGLLAAAREALLTLDVCDDGGLSKPVLGKGDVGCLTALMDLLIKVRDEPSVYLMVRRTA